MRKLVFVLALGLLVLTPQTAAAHVLITDDSKAVGAVLHVIPDDDPIAGQPSDLFFDVETQQLTEATLTITNTATGEAADVPVTLGDNSVTASYTFPTQGAYNLSFTATADKMYAFTYTQRVSRGTTGSPLDKPAYPLASLALVFSVTAFLFFMVLMFNHRHDIRKHSTF